MPARTARRQDSPAPADLHGVVPERAPGDAEQGRAQLGDVPGLLGGRRAGVLRESSDLGAVGAVELPGDVDGALDQVELDGVARVELADPGVEPVLVGLGVLAGQDRQPARQPCLTALNRERSLPSVVLGPVLFWALRRLISARSGWWSSWAVLWLWSPSTRRDSIEQDAWRSHGEGSLSALGGRSGRPYA